MYLVHMGTLPHTTTCALRFPSEQKGTYWFWINCTALSNNKEYEVLIIDPRNPGEGNLPPTYAVEDEGLVERNFSHHPPSPSQGEYHAAWRDEFKHLAEKVTMNLPNSRERSLALTKLEESLFWVNAHIARDSYDISKALGQQKGRASD